MPDVYRCVVAVRRPRAGMDTVAYQRLWAFEPGGRIGLSWSWEIALEILKDLEAEPVEAAHE